MYRVSPPSPSGPPSLEDRLAGRHDLCDEDDNHRQYKHKYKQPSPLSRPPSLLECTFYLSLESGRQQVKKETKFLIQIFLENVPLHGLLPNTLDSITPLMQITGFR